MLNQVRAFMICANPLFFALNDCHIRANHATDQPLSHERTPPRDHTRNANRRHPTRDKARIVRRACSFASVRCRDVSVAFVQLGIASPLPIVALLLPWVLLLSSLLLPLLLLPRCCCSRCCCCVVVGVSVCVCVSVCVWVGGGGRGFLCWTCSLLLW